MKAISVVGWSLVFDSIIIIAYLILFVLQIPFTILLSYVISIIYIINEKFRNTFQIGDFKKYFYPIVVLLPAALTLNHGLTPLVYLFLSPFLLYAGYIFSLRSLAHICSALKIVYYFFILIILVGLLMHWNEPEPLGSILPWASTNGIPSYLIVVQIAYSIAYFLEKNKLPLFSSVVTLCIAVVGLGRGSMIIGFLILNLTLFYNLFVCKSLQHKILNGWILCFIVFLLLTTQSKNGSIGNELILFMDGSKFASGFVDEHRLIMLRDYFGKIDGVTLFFGSGYEGTSINDYYGGNPHNSFIRLHSFYGSTALFGVVVPLILVLASNKALIQKIIILSLIALALLRATSEPIFFPSTLDFFYFLYFVLFFRFAKIK
jgi:hypothetical protein